MATDYAKVKGAGTTARWLYWLLIGQITQALIGQAGEAHIFPKTCSDAGSDPGEVWAGERVHLPPEGPLRPCGPAPERRHPRAGGPRGDTVLSLVNLTLTLSTIGQVWEIPAVSPLWTPMAYAAFDSSKLQESVRFYKNLLRLWSLNYHFAAFRKKIKRRKKRLRKMNPS